MNDIDYFEVRDLNSTFQINYPANQWNSTIKLCKHDKDALTYNAIITAVDRCGQRSESVVVELKFVSAKGIN